MEYWCVELKVALAGNLNYNYSYIHHVALMQQQSSFPFTPTHTHTWEEERKEDVALMVQTIYKIKNMCTTRIDPNTILLVTWLILDKSCQQYIYGCVCWGEKGRWVLKIKVSFLAFLQFSFSCFIDSRTSLRNHCSFQHNERTKQMTCRQYFLKPIYNYMQTQTLGYLWWFWAKIE